MRVFVAGAAGAIGRCLVPMLVAEGHEVVGMTTRPELPLVGEAGGLSSFIHVDDAASATVAALERGRRGVYNVVDDDPAPVREWLPSLAEGLGAKPPRRIPRWVARLVAGEAAAVMITEGRGASNERAKRELGWRPAYPSWRQGFRSGSG